MDIYHLCLQLGNSDHPKSPYIMFIFIEYLSSDFHVINIYICINNYVMNIFLTF